MGCAAQNTCTLRKIQQRNSELELPVFCLKNGCIAADAEKCTWENQ
jgi:hypothetical protein